MSEKTIGIFGHVGNGNLGDEAIISSVIQNLRRIDPGARVVGLSVNPEDTEQRHRIQAYPIRCNAANPGYSDGEVQDGSLAWARVRGWARSVPGARTAVRTLRWLMSAPPAFLSELRFLRSSYGVVRELDLIIVAGSSQLNDDWGGAWGFPYTLFKWGMLARLTRTPVAYVSVGATPLHSRLSHTFHRFGLSRAAYRSYRDAGSKRLVQQTLHPATNDPVVPDLVFSLELAPSGRTSTSRRPLAVLNPMSLYDGATHPSADPEGNARYLVALEEAAKSLALKGYDIRLFSTQERIDRAAVDRVAAAVRPVLERVGGELSIEWPTSAEEIAHTLASADLVLGTRFHAILIALLLEKPVVGVAYQAKSRELLASIGQEQFAVDVSDCSSESLIGLLNNLEHLRSDFVRSVQESLPAKRNTLAAQYTQLLELARPRRHSVVSAERTLDATVPRTL